MNRKTGRQMVPGMVAVFVLWATAFSAGIHCSPARQLAKQALFDSSIVFEPAAGAYASMRIPALVATPKGTLLAFCEARVPNSSDWAEMDLLMRRSTDGGTTWEPVQ